ncbi:MAG: dephospho-CoA kinase [Tissierellaceae bacterium]|nr:dephospho-CoA kinase [Tissierellaceae bacterium]
MKRNKLRLIGLTGGIATGKSTVSNMLIDKGYAVIDSDKISREVVEPQKPAYNKITQEFGKSIINEDKTINRKALGKLIFNDDQARKKLNSIIHPYILNQTLKIIGDLSKSNDIIFLDIPLLFEEYQLFTEYGIEFDEIWLIYTTRNTQIKRLMDRDKISKEEALKKIAAQIDINEKKTRSSKIIDNGGDLRELKLKIEKALNEII